MKATTLDDFFQLVEENVEHADIYSICDCKNKISIYIPKKHRISDYFYQIYIGDAAHKMGYFTNDVDEFKNQIKNYINTIDLKMICIESEDVELNDSFLKQ